MENIESLLNIETFLSKYPNIYNSEEKILNPYKDKNFNDIIVTKKEFSDLKLPRTENQKKKGSGQQYNHQKIISRFMNSNTPYNELLLFHEMGTGKTCTAISVIENLRKDFKNKNLWSNIDGAIICAKGGSLLKNFVNELLFSCTDGRYIPENYENLTNIEKTYRVRKNISTFYETHTFETFAKEISKMSDSNIIKRYSNKIFVIDEVHNLREKNTETEKTVQDVDFQIYKQFHRLFHIIKESKILLMSGTVMKDDPSEFASVMNLILPLNKQLPTGKFFMKKFFESNGLFNKNKKELENVITGRISYLKAMSSDVKKIFKGSIIGNLKHFIVFPLIMSDFQNSVCEKAFEKDQIERNIFLNTRQALLFAFPDGSYGTKGFEKYVSVYKPKTYFGKKQPKVLYKLNKELVNEIKDLNNLEKFSSKFSMTIKTILENPKHKSLVYCEYVNGGGCILFAKILELFGFKEASGDETTKGLRYAILTNQTTTQNKIQKLISKFNASANIDGEIISVIIGSKVISEGFTLKNVRKEFIFTPHWNYSETSQVIARGWRLGSHNDLLKRGDKNIEVEVYQLVSLSKKTKTSIDLTMYETSELKDIAMKQIEFMVKTSGFDCPLTIERNKIFGYDNMRECDYKNCDYKCDGEIKKELDVSTFNLYYSSFDEFYNGLKIYFKTNFIISIDEIKNIFPKMTFVEIISSIKKIIDDSIQFRNKYGFLSYLRMQENNLFITTDPTSPNNDKLSEYYNQNYFIQSGNLFRLILKQMSIDRLPQIIDAIFKYPDFLRNIIASLPHSIQSILLQGCIQAEIKNIQLNSETRKKILELFKGFFDKIDGKWTVWIFKEELGVSFLDETENDDTQNFISFPSGIWNKSVITKLIETHIQNKKKELNDSPIGIYGLYNPHLDEFCLRESSNLKFDDLRKISVGRRCSDWTMPLLVDIIARRISLEIPETKFTESFENLKLMAEKLKTKKILKNEDLENQEQLRKVLYWSSISRSEICQKIKVWLQEKGLVDENFDCGTQKKQRVNYLKENSN
jgi:superfamily II DNA or RNA helicase